MTAESLPRRVLMGENLVWDAGVKVGSHHYAEQIRARWGAEVLWVSLPWTPAHLLTRADSARRRRRAWRWGRGTLPAAGLRVLSPLSWVQYRNSPMLRSPSMAILAQRLTMPKLRDQIRKAGFAAPDVVWISDPRQVGLLDLVRPGRIVYRCPDHLAGFSDVPPSVTDLERRLIGRADLVVGSSQALVAHLTTLGAAALHVPNGVEYERFAAVPRSGPNSPPRVLYAGAMGEWFDAGLLREVAVARRQYRFVLAGPLRADLSGLLSEPNVEYVGIRPYETVPALMAGSDVGVIPFRTGVISEAVNPIKLFEYLAAGLPVVVTGIGDLGGLEHHVAVVFGVDEFLAALDRAVAERGDTAATARRRALARDHSWDARFSAISAALGIPLVY